MQSKDQKNFLKKARAEYYKVGSMPCPAFGEELVYFNKHGFDHLIRKGKKLRMFEEQCKRIKLISQAVEMIRNGNIFVQYRKSELVSKVQFWSFVRKTNQGIITVVVRQIESGRKHFFSVMN